MWRKVWQTISSELVWLLLSPESWQRRWHHPQWQGWPRRGWTFVSGSPRLLFGLDSLGSISLSCNWNIVGVYHGPESTSFLDHLIPSCAKRSLASGSSKTKPIVFPSIMTAFSLSFPNVPAFSSRSISLLRIPLAVATSPLILKIISKLKWRRCCPLDERLHPGVDHPAALADVDGGLLLVPGQHPHVDLRSQQVGNCVRNPREQYFLKSCLRDLICFRW